LASFDMNEQSVPGWLRYLGKISYGLYIFHMLMLSLAFGLRAWITAHFRVPKLPLIGIKLSIPFVALALTVLTAAISYRWLESPFLRLRKRFTVVRSRPV
jgi:peptidoglycan/LPS O-acetylase OafA/YrhL